MIKKINQREFNKLTLDGTDGRKSFILTFYGENFKLYLLVEALSEVIALDIYADSDWAHLTEISDEQIISDDIELLGASLNLHCLSSLVITPVKKRVAEVFNHSFISNSALALCVG